MAKNIEKAVERCGLKVESLIFSALASSMAVLTEDEKDLGVALVDMGAGTIDINIYTGGVLRHTAVIPAAGNQVTSDIAKIFRTPLNHAEEIKTKYACALRELVGKDDHIEVPSVGGRPSRSMARHILAEVVEPRYQELFELVRDQISQSGLEEQIAAGIVLTGGCGRMEGAVEFAEEIFQMPVRLGEPLGMHGLSDYVQDPTYATAVGLLRYAQQNVQNRQRESSSTNVIGLGKRLLSWFKGEF